MTTSSILKSALVGVLGLLLQAGAPTAAEAQTTSNTDSLVVLPSLEAVLAQSRAFAPHIEERRALLRKNEQLVDRASKTWLDGISFGVQSTAGTYGNTTVDQLNVGATASASVRFSLFDIFAQRDQKKIMRYELEISREMIRKAEVEEAGYVVGLYHHVDEQQRQLAVRADSWRSAQIHREMAELEFTNGNISVAELARVSAIESKAHSDYLNATSAFRSAYRQLEVRIGAPLSSLRTADSSKR